MTAPALARASIRAAAIPAPAGPWSTPARLRAFLFASLAGALLLLLTGESTLSGQRVAIRTIGKDAAPSVLIANKLYESFADFDANVANTLVGTEQHRAAAADALERRRLDITDSIVDAAEHITFGDAEREPIRRMADGWSTYLDRVSEVRVRRGDGDLRAAAARYFEASRQLHQGLLAAAGALDVANHSALDVAYESERRWSQGADALPLLVGGALLAVLVSAQIFCFRRMRRIVNPGLAAATGVTLTLVVYLLFCFHTGAETIRGAREDAFASLRVLWRARAVGYDALGDETRGLLDPFANPDPRGAFDANVARLTNAPGAPAAPAAFVGLLADERNNVTYPGEREAVDAMIRAYAAYYAVHRRVRDADRAGRHAEAVDLALGPAADAFARFDRALDQALAINQRQFDRLIAQGDGAVTAAEIVNAVFALTIGVLVFIGIRPRLREYGS